MTEIPQLTKILDKTKHLLKECNLPLDLLRVNKDSKESHLQTILQSLDEAIKYVILTRGIGEEYMKLEQIVQRQENELRRRVGIEMQLKLYHESLQQQLEESEHTRSQFIESTRVMISDLKRSNQILIEQNRRLKKNTNPILRQSLTRADVLRTIENETINEGQRRKRRPNQLVSSKKIMRTEISRDKSSPKREAKLSVPHDINNLVDVKLSFGSRYGQQNNTNRRRKQSHQRKSYNRNVLESSSYHQLYASKVDDFRQSYPYHKTSKRRSLKKSSMSSRPDDNEIKTAHKNIH